MFNDDVLVMITFFLYLFLQWNDTFVSSLIEDTSRISRTVNLLTKKNKKISNIIKWTFVQLNKGSETHQIKNFNLEIISDEVFKIHLFL